MKINRADVLDGLDMLDQLNDHGQEFEPTPRPKGLRKMGDGACWRNAQRTMLTHPELDYAEGLAQSDIHGMWILHAWNVDHDGHAVDRTWARPARRYIGIVIDRKTACKTMLTNDSAGGPILVSR
jgi:hypothetical protein